MGAAPQKAMRSVAPQLAQRRILQVGCRDCIAVDLASQPLADYPAAVQLACASRLASSGISCKKQASPRRRALLSKSADVF